MFHLWRRERENIALQYSLSKGIGGTNTQTRSFPLPASPQCWIPVIKIDCYFSFREIYFVPSVPRSNLVKREGRNFLLSYLVGTEY